MAGEMMRPKSRVLGNADLVAEQIRGAAQRMLPHEWAEIAQLLSDIATCANIPAPDAALRELAVEAQKLCHMVGLPYGDPFGVEGADDLGDADQEQEHADE